MHYHLTTFRCSLCTIEQAGLVLCQIENYFIPCVHCGCTRMIQLSVETQHVYDLHMIMAGTMFKMFKLPGQISSGELLKKLGLIDAN